jgi:hypothetical protein
VFTYQGIGETTPAVAIAELCDEGVEAAIITAGHRVLLFLSEYTDLLAIAGPRRWTSSTISTAVRHANFRNVS